MDNAKATFKFWLFVLLLQGVVCIRPNLRWSYANGRQGPPLPLGCCLDIGPSAGTPGEPCASRSPCSWNQTGDTIFISEHVCCEVGKLNPNATKIELQNCIESYNYAKVDYDQIYRLLAASLGNVSNAIISEAEQMMAIAQMAVESKGFSAPREEACVKTTPPPAKCRHAGPKKDNCTKDTPNEFYFGRGYIHLTGCPNYKAASFGLYGDDRLVKNPDLVASDPVVAMETAIWFWKTNVHKRKGVQNGDFGATTKAIHGSGACTDPKWLPNSKLRYQLLLRCLKASGQYDKLKDKINESGCYPVPGRIRFMSMLKATLNALRMGQQQHQNPQIFTYRV